jgi:hypothetical protein
LGDYFDSFFCKFFFKPFLAHLSELKAQVSYSDHPLSGICPSVNFYIFDLFSRTTGSILTRIGTNNPWGEGIQADSKGDSPSPRGDNSEREKIH